MKLKTLVIGGSGLFLMVFSLLLFVAILFSDEQDSGISNIHYGGVNVSAEVLAHKPMVEKYAKEYGVENDLLSEALRELPDKKREILLLFYFMDMSDSEIADLLKLNRSTVYRHRTSGLALIKKFMEEFEE